MTARAEQPDGRRAVLRRELRRARRRLRASARPLVQAALATPISWIVCSELLAYENPVFAPISVIVAIGSTVAQPWQRAAEIVVGVAIGVGLADALTLLVGQGAWQIGVMVLGSMVVATALRASPTLVIQAGTAAVLVASLPTADGAASLQRFVATLVGGGVALLFTLVLLPVRPIPLAQRALRPVLDRLAVTFERIGEGLAFNDAEIADDALSRARATGDLWARLNEAVGVGRQATRIAPVRRRDEAVLLDVAQTVIQLDYAIRDARVMARTALRLTETGCDAGPRLELAMRELAAAVRALEGHLDGRFDSTLDARRAAIRASMLATAASSDADDLVLVHLVGQVRSTTVDLLRATGMDRGDAITEMLAGVEAARGDVG